MSIIALHDAADIEALPDGTTISWERIPGDATSRAIAFVRVVRTPEVRNGGVDTECDCRDVTWISPGGWDPKSIEDAGVTYPAHVVILGDLTEYLFDGAPHVPPPAEAMLPDPPVMEGIDLESYPLLSGGTYPRDEALRNAVALVARQYQPYLDVETAVLPIAEVFERWLGRDALAEALNDAVQSGVVAVHDAVNQAKLDLAGDLELGHIARLRAQEEYALPYTIADRTRVVRMAKALRDDVERSK